MPALRVLQLGGWGPVWLTMRIFALCFSALDPALVTLHSALCILEHAPVQPQSQMAWLFNFHAWELCVYNTCQPQPLGLLQRCG